MVAGIMLQSFVDILLPASWVTLEEYGTILKEFFVDLIQS